MFWVISSEKYSNCVSLEHFKDTFPLDIKFVGISKNSYTQPALLILKGWVLSIDGVVDQGKTMKYWEIPNVILTLLEFSLIRAKTYDYLLK